MKLLNKKEIKNIQGLTSYILLLWLLFLQADVYACLQPVTINDRIDGATQIAVGRVIQATAQWDTEKKNIYTIYTFQSNSFLKQSTNFQYVDIVIPGGVIGDEAQIMSPSIELLINQEYLFFLTPSSTSLEKTATPIHPSYELYGYVQGSLPLTDGNFQDFFGSKPIGYATLVEYIKKRTGFDPIQIEPTLPNQAIPIRRSSSYQSNIRSTISLTDGNGIPTNIFYAGRIEKEYHMKISGSGFGFELGTILFSNSDNGGQNLITLTNDSDIVSWTDTEIEVKIPLAAGSGIMQVVDASNALIGEQNIEISWTIKPIYSTYKNFTVPTRQYINFIDNDGQGGYTLKYNTPSGLGTNEAAKAAFERALSTWHCATGVHFTTSTEHTNEGPAKDDISSIMFQAAIPLGVVAMTSSRYKASGSTNCDLYNTTWYLREFDMQFAHPDNMLPGLSWSFETHQATSEQFDFESIALHELGHAHGLGHINDPRSSMYYSIENGKTKRSLTNREVEAGLYQMERSKTENCISSKLPMHVHSGFCEDQLVPNATARVKVLLEGFYDEDNLKMRTNLAENNLLPLQQPFHYPPFNYFGSEQLTSLPSNMVDWVLIRMRDGNDFNTILCERAAILRSDGIVQMVNGAENIQFDCVNAGNYHVSITHRSHLSVVTKNPQSLSLSDPIIDFTKSTSSAFGEEQLKAHGNLTFLYSGDFDCNGVINNKDYNVWKINGADINVYSSADADGNGIISSLDYNLWKSNRSKIGVINEN